MPHTPILAPSLLAADHTAFGEGALLVEKLGLKWIHLDIMDAHFVPNLSFGPQLLKDLRSKVGLFFDTHLMMAEPHLYIDAFIASGAQNISIHVEPAYPIEDTLKYIRKTNCQTGIALNPNTPAEAIFPYLHLVDLVLVMTVQPGFGGQSFREAMLPKIAEINKERTKENLSFRIEVDGGIDTHTGALCWEEGADTFVTGSAFFHSLDKPAFIKSFEDFKS